MIDVPDLAACALLERPLAYPLLPRRVENASFERIHSHSCLAASPRLVWALAWELAWAYPNPSKVGGFLYDSFV